ncbi:MAG: OmpA family protein [Tannerella sp.]|jgi:chemotaxis protein MotB|nr:OmpA family protein [Tannerella sp.]
MKSIYYLVACLLIVGASSCVTKKKYLIAENGRLDALARGEILSEQLAECRGEGERLSDRVHDLAGDTAALGRSLREYRTLLSSNLSEQDKLNALLQQKMGELSKREQTINELQEMINAQNEKVRALLNSVKEALLGFDSDELSVTEKNGKVYVALSDKLLFESGSAKVDKRGKEALALLAGVLNKQTGIDVFIEGHTDSKPINTAQFKDNWDLSVIRATSVVRILTKDYGVNPLQIQPSGRGEYMPVADNETVDGRSRNRRTEIIMAPKLDKLLEMLQ